MDEQERAFCAALDESPRDWTMRLVYSDWLEEHGRTDDAIVQRFMAKKNVSPAKFFGTDSWIWEETWMFSGSGGGVVSAKVLRMKDLFLRVSCGPFLSRHDAECNFKIALLGTMGGS